MTRPERQRTAVLPGLLLLALVPGCPEPAGSPPPPDAEAPASRLLRACASLGLCLDPYYANDEQIRRCADAYDELVEAGIRLDAQIDCLAAAMTCVEVGACTECVPGRAEETCDGDAAHTCVLGRWATRPCPAGQTCVQSGSSPECSLGACWGSAHACEGSVARWCDGADLHEEDCASAGWLDAVCVDSGERVSCATAPVRVCDQDHFAWSCDGAVATVCDRGYAVAQDCALLPSRTTCVLVGPSDELWATCG